MAPSHQRYTVRVKVIASILLISYNVILRTVNAGLVKCRLQSGSIPFRFRCDEYPNTGTAKDLDNQVTDQLNTAMNLETSEITATRLNSNIGGVDEPRTSSRLFSNQNSDDDELYNPTFDAYCFNEDYPVPSLPSIDAQIALYLDYKAVFDAALNTTNIFVSQDRIPGMFLRMCFHDNTINIEDTDMDFRTYVANAIDPETKKWTAESRFMLTSGADASNLICPEERKHPNNNLDQTATKVLTRIQRSATLKAKHPNMSYVDLLHNGCNAATIYLTNTDPTTALTYNPFSFGRKDACHVDVKCGKKHALCGPSEVLPGVNVNVNDVSDWFTSRGMTLCSMMALMWTHTTVEEFNFACPIQKLICTATQEDASSFDDINRYFQGGDALDYYDFFLNRGTHVPDTDSDDCNYSVPGGCHWTVDEINIPWPMTRIDCTLGLSNVKNITGSSSELTNVIQSFVHNSTYYKRYNLLQCALNQLGGTGIGAADNANNACAQVVPAECQANAEHMFGSFYSTLPPTTRPRTTVDPDCERFGYRRHRGRHLFKSDHSHSIDSETVEYVMKPHSDCLGVAYNVYLTMDGIHFALFTNPIYNNDNSTTFCPPLLVHSLYDETSLEMEKVMIVFPSEVESMNDDMSFHLGILTLDNILETYETVNVGYEKSDESGPSPYFRPGSI